MLGDLLVIWSCDFWGLPSHKSNGSAPFSGVEGSLDCLVEDTSLDIVLNGEIELLLADQPVSPLLLQGDNMAWESSSGKINGLSEGMASDKGVHGSIKNVHLLKEITSFFMHARGDQLSGDLLKLVLWDSNVEAAYNISCFCWKSTFEIETYGSVVVTFSFFDLSSLGLLVCLEKPLEIVFFEFSDIWVVLLLGDFDTLVPSMELLIHCHCLFNLIMLDEDRLSLVELLVKNCQFGLDSEVIDAFLGDKLVDLSKIVCLGDVSEGGVASLSNEEVLLLERHFGDGLPVGFRLWGQFERLEDLNCSTKAVVLEGSAELDESLIEVVSDSVGSVINQDLGLAFTPLNGFDITLDLVHGDLVGLLDAVPDAEVVPVLSNDDVGVWNPADELAVVEEGLLLLLLDVVEVQLSSLVSEKELAASWVELKVVNLAVVVHSGLNLVESQVLDADGQAIEQVSDDLGWLTSS